MMMIRLLKKRHSKKQSKYLPAPGYVGKTLEKIISQHPNHKRIPYYDRNKKSFIMEVQLENSTLSCIIQRGRCMEAYQFSD